MIQDDNELACTQERIAYFVGLLSRLRIAATPEEFPLMSDAYRAEVERMQQEVLDYVSRHSTATIAKAG